MVATNRAIGWNHSASIEDNGSVVYVVIHNGTVVVARIYKGATYTYYSQRLPYEMADCSPSELEFYAMIFIMTHWLTA